MVKFAGFLREYPLLFLFKLTYTIMAKSVLCCSSELADQKSPRTNDTWLVGNGGEVSLKTTRIPPIIFRFSHQMSHIFSEMSSRIEMVLELLVVVEKSFKTIRTAPIAFRFFIECPLYQE